MTASGNRWWMSSLMDEPLYRRSLPVPRHKTLTSIVASPTFPTMAESSVA